MDDSRLDKLGTYFVNMGIREQYGITFDEFVKRVDNGTWKLMFVSEYTTR